MPVPGGRNEAREAADMASMQTLDHERLDVYHLAMEFLVFANSVIEGLPRGRSHLADEFTRASMSVVLNIAEGAGKVSKGDKRRYDLTARGSATESAALLDVCLRLKLLDAAQHQGGKEKVVRIVAMLIRLAQACEESRTASDA
ncbi:MAG: four helix bundle protein [Labilithrix sp.]|nr:four helix bundle protein [Labilithrix sp.]